MTATDENNPNSVEECDDGNTDAGDGCDAECSVESAAGASAGFSFSTAWGTGYCVTLDVTNEADEPTTTWTATIDTNGATIFTSWNADFTGNSGEIGLTPLSWNSVIAPGATISSVGFCANRAPGDPDPEVVSVSAEY